MAGFVDNGMWLREHQYREFEELQTNKIICKENYDMDENSKEEKDYTNYPIHQFYHFDSPEVRERILYANFMQVNQDVKDMIKEIQEFNKIM